MNTTLEYTLFGILFLTNAYILYKIELIKVILSALTKVAARLTSISEAHSEMIKKSKN
jgi:hypothetical protein